jgi:hypothetical protein
MSINVTVGSTPPLVVDLGPANTGVAANLGYRIIAPNGSTFLARQSNPSASIVETLVGSGIYIAQRTFTTPFTGALVWDLTPPGTVFATEDISVVPVTSLPGVIVGGVPVAVTVTDSVTAAPLANVSVQVYLQSDITFSTVIALGFTNSSGQVTVFVPPAMALTLRLMKSGYAQISFYFLSQLSSQPPLSFAFQMVSLLLVPGFPGQVVVFDNLIDDRGQPLVGVPVIARISLKPSFVVSTGQLISPDFVEVVTDSLGFWQIPLLPNDLIKDKDGNVGTTRHEFEIGRLEPRVRKTAKVAITPSAQRFGDLLP